jgi:hypothetical protein
MIKNAIKGVVYLTAFGVLGYLFFFVPLGERTTFDHVRRIAATDEAQELGDEVGDATEQAESALREKLREELVDAGGGR